jgi:hypothetical protein
LDQLRQNLPSFEPKAEMFVELYPIHPYLFNALFQLRADECYAMSDHFGETFFIEAVAVSPVRERLRRFLASALEEFIIDKVQETASGMHLLNKTGIEQ